MKKNRLFICALALCLILTSGALASAPFITVPMTTFTKEETIIRETFSFRGMDLNGTTLDAALALLQAENVVVKQDNLANNETRLTYKADFAGYADADVTLFFYNGTLYKGQYHYEFNYASLEKIEKDILGKLSTLYGERDLTRVQMDQDFQNARVFHWEAEGNTCLDLMFPLSFNYDQDAPSKMAFKLEYYSMWPTLVNGPASVFEDLPSSEEDVSGL